MERIEHINHSCFIFLEKFEFQKTGRVGQNLSVYVKLTVYLSIKDKVFAITHQLLSSNGQQNKVQYMRKIYT